MSVHRPTVLGRVRSDPGLLLLTALVVALTSALLAAVAPLTARTSDDAIAATVRDAGPRGAVVATAGRGYVDREGQDRDPGAATEIEQQTDFLQRYMPRPLRDVVRPGVATLTSPSLHLLDAGAGRYLRLAYVDPPGAGPAVRWTAGGPPQPSVPADQADVHVPAGEPWPVQVGLSDEVATALGLAPGDEVTGEDEQHRPVTIVVSGTFEATDLADETWRSLPELLHPSVGVTAGAPHSAAAALVTADALPDLRLAVPADSLVQRAVFVLVPERVHYADVAAMEQAVAQLQASGSAATGFSWDSLLDRVLDEGVAQVDSARGQAAVLLLGLLGAALLVLVLAAELLVSRRAGSVAVERERGATLLEIALELFVEALGVAVLGAGLGVLAVALLLGDVGWRWVAPVVVVAALAAPVFGALRAAAVTDVRRVPANRSARRTTLRTRQLRRLLVEGAVVAAAALTLVALHQRGVVVDGRTDPTAASAALWWSLAGAVLLVRAVPPLARWALRATRRGTGGVGFFVASRVAAAGGRALPLLVVVVAVAQLVLGVALAVTEREGQRDGALQDVGGDARLTTVPAAGVADLAAAVADERGVRAAAAGRVADGARASSRGSATTVRLVALDSAAYARLLAASDLPDVAGLERLRSDAGSSVPALLTGGDADLAQGLQVRWQGSDPVALSVVGRAPRVDGSLDPVIVVDGAVLAAHGLDLPPDTVWAVGPGAEAAVRAHASAGDTVTRYSAVLAARRSAPLPAALLHLALAAAGLLLLLAVLGVVLAAALAAPARAESLGRLRALGLGAPALRRVLAGELLAPVVVAAVAGLVLGVSAAEVTLGELALGLVTGQPSAPPLLVPWWVLLLALLPLPATLVVARVEAAALRRAALAQLLRAGDRRR